MKNRHFVLIGQTVEFCILILKSVMENIYCAFSLLLKSAVYDTIDAEGPSNDP